MVHIGDCPITTAKIGKLQAVGLADGSEDRAAGPDMDVPGGADDHLGHVGIGHLADPTDLDGHLAHDTAAVGNAMAKIAVDDDLIALAFHCQREGRIGAQHLDLDVVAGFGDHNHPGDSVPDLDGRGIGAAGKGKGGTRNVSGGMDFAKFREYVDEAAKG